MIYTLNITPEDLRRIAGTDTPPVFARLSAPNGYCPGPRFFGVYLRQKDDGVEMRTHSDYNLIEAIQYIAERLRAVAAPVGE